MAGTLCPDNIGWWILIVCLLNVLLAAGAVVNKKVYPLVWVIAADGVFYLWAELDAPLAANPLLMYLPMAAIVVLGAVVYYALHGCNGKALIATVLADMLLNGFFCGLDMNLIHI